MKIVLISAASSIHTVRWANSLSRFGHEVHVVSQHPVIEKFDLNVKLYLFPFRGGIGYFSMVPSVRELLLKLKPDIVNAHYASGYGTTARLVGYHPWILSVWGSDIYNFPYKTVFHKWLVKKNLRSADMIASTSKCMADEAFKLLPELSDIAITPFGVDLNSYSDIKPLVPQNKTKVVIGTVKAMKLIYGIDTLIRAFALLVKSLKANPELCAPELELRLVGSGEQARDLEELSVSLGISDSVSFVGRVPHTEVPKELGKLDIFVALSRSESFGVAVIEAGAAGLPVVVSDAGGLPEVTIESVTGFIVPRENPEQAALALKKLVLNAELRHDMGVAAKAHVANSYSWDFCVKKMIYLYEETVREFQG